jgi:hypothetical protein
MSEQTPQLPAEFVFSTADLYARSGFSNGAFFKDAFPNLSANELRDLLVDVLQQHVLPKLDQSVQTLLVPSVHNPLRVTSVDGNGVDWLTPEAGHGAALTPARIRVPAEAVLSSAKRLRLAAPSRTAA